MKRVPILKSDVYAEDFADKNDLQKSSDYFLNNTVISNIQDADAPHAVVELQSAQNAYQAALSATSHVYQNSLLNFLK